MFELDPRLENSSFKLIDFPLCEVRLKDNQHFPWILLIPKVNQISEMFALSESDQKIVISEVTRVSRVMQQYFSATKINIAALGNMVPQLHIHVVARFENDLCWPHSIWQPNTPENPYPCDQKDHLITQLRALLS
jgi:diadenosine tetraphosphate (Ap4A) HIT family hydrolase